jgi:hypothetical protein
VALELAARAENLNEYLLLLHDVLTCDALFVNRFAVALNLETKIQRAGSSLAAPPR